MFGWSIRASACRSASKRATTWRLSMPGLMTFSATRRRTGSRCSARKTTPMPPSPISATMVYGPIVEPGPSATPSRGGRGAAGNSRNVPRPTSAASRAFKCTFCARRRRQRRGTPRRGGLRDRQRGEEDVAFLHGEMRGSGAQGRVRGSMRDWSGRPARNPRVGAAQSAGEPIASRRNERA